jgi:hypothetical protein
MAMFQGVTLLFLGGGVLFVVYASLSTGWLPCGPDISKGLFGRVEVNRQEQPLGYWLLFGVYGVAGVWMVVFGIALLAGHATPLPMR